MASVSVERRGKGCVHRCTLLNATTAQTNGEWVNVSGAWRASLDISGITTATVEVDVSNDTTQPDNATHGRQLTTVTSDTMINIPMNVHFIKARITAFTSGAITANYEGVSD